MPTATSVVERPLTSRAILLLAIVVMSLTTAGPARSGACSFQPQGEGRVEAVMDASSFRLSDGREIRLAGIVAGATDKEGGRAALAAIVSGHDVTLRGDDDTPDRYGRQPAFVFLGGAHMPVQGLLLAQGSAMVSTVVTNKECTALLMSAEAEARREKRGLWNDPAAIKNAESPDDILAGIGRFTVVEGRVLSARQAGATTYLNFGRNWTRGFAATIPRRALSTFEAAGLPPKSLENRRIRVRGWVEARVGPRIELLRVGQIELLDGN